MNHKAKIGNTIRKCGKRTKSDKVLLEIGRYFKKANYKNPNACIEKASKSLSPMVALRNESRSGQAVQVPTGMSIERQVGVAFRNIRKWSSEHKSEAASKAIAKGLIQLVETNVKVGKANADDLGMIKERNRLHRMAVAQFGSLQ